ncbi:MAG: preprotein translocase subunit SecE, partial [Eubacterium aggregans]
SNVTKQNTVAPEVVKQEKNEVTADKKAKDGNSNANKASKKTAKSKKPNIFVRAIDFIKSVFAELKKVSWLTSDELMKSTSVVAWIVAIMTLMTWVVDSGLGVLAALLIGSK